MTGVRCFENSDCSEKFFCDLVVSYCVPCSKFCFEGSLQCLKKCPGFLTTTIVNISDDTTATISTTEHTVSHPSWRYILLSVLLGLLILLLFIMVILCCKGCKLRKTPEQLRICEEASHIDSLIPKSSVQERTSDRPQESSFERNTNSNSIICEEMGFSPCNSENHSFSIVPPVNETSFLQRKTVPVEETDSSQEHASMLCVSNTVISVGHHLSSVQHNDTVRKQPVPSQLDTSLVASVQPSTEQPTAMESYVCSGQNVSHSTGRSVTERAKIDIEDDTRLMGDIERSFTEPVQSVDGMVGSATGRVQSWHSSTQENKLPKLKESSPSRRENSGHDVRLEDLHSWSRVSGPGSTVRGLAVGNSLKHGSLERRVEKEESLKMPVQVAESAEIDVIEDLENENLPPVLELRVFNNDDQDGSDEETVLKEPCGLSQPQQEVSPFIPGLLNFNPHLHPNRRIYNILRRIQWVQGYYSEGREIEVFVNYNDISPEVALQKLVEITKEKPEKFKISKHSGT